MDGEGFDCPGGKTGRAGAEDGRRRAGCHHAGGTDRKAEGKAKTILFNLSGHGMIDLYAYEQYLGGNLQNFELSDQEIAQSLDKLEKIM